jgi:hypothetical protein
VNFQKGFRRTAIKGAAMLSERKEVRPPNPIKNRIFQVVLLLAALGVVAVSIENARVAFLSENVGKQLAVTPRVKKRLPDMSETGGVVIFFHVAKTGGTTIRSNVAQMPGVRRLWVLDTPALFKNYTVEATSYLKGQPTDPTKPILFLEFHGFRSIGMKPLHNAIEKWRAVAAQYNTSLFTFTVLREPVSFAVSNFNFFYAEPCSFGEKGCFWPLWPATEKSLVATASPNLQCLLLVKDHNTIFKNATRPDVKKRECVDIYEMMRQDMDWIGRTETLSTETEPLLAHVLLGNASKAAEMRVYNHNSLPAQLKASKLSTAAIQYITNISQFDQAMYERTQMDYPIEMWEELEPQNELLSPLEKAA